MHLHLTKKLARKLHVAELPEPAATHGGLTCWYSNVFSAYRRQYIIATNSDSLFSVVFFGTGITSYQKYVTKFQQMLPAYLQRLGLDLRYEAAVGPKTQPTFWKTANRSVLSSMNNNVTVCKWLLDKADYPPDRLADRVNSTLCRGPNYIFPVDALCEMLNHDAPTNLTNRGLELL